MLFTEVLRKELVAKLIAHIGKLDHPSYTMDPSDSEASFRQMGTGNYTLLQQEQGFRGRLQ